MLNIIQWQTDKGRALRDARGSMSLGRGGNCNTGIVTGIHRQRQHQGGGRWVAVYTGSGNMQGRKGGRWVAVYTGSGKMQGRKGGRWLCGGAAVYKGGGGIREDRPRQHQGRGRAVSRA
jgi:hypothetical protein